MCIEQKISIVTDVMDLIAGFELLAVIEKPQQLQCVIDTLGSYPKPQKKTDIIKCDKRDLSAYLCISNVRNACKLAQIGTYSFGTGLNIASFNLEFVLLLLSE